MFSKTEVATAPVNRAIYSQSQRPGRKSQEKGLVLSHLTPHLGYETPRGSPLSEQECFCSPIHRGLSREASHQCGFLLKSAHHRDLGAAFELAVPRRTCEPQGTGPGLLSTSCFPVTMPGPGDYSHLEKMMNLNCSKKCKAVLK